MEGEIFTIAGKGSVVLIVCGTEATRDSRENSRENNRTEIGNLTMAKFWCLFKRD